MRHSLAFALCFAAGPALADVNAVIDTHILPGEAAFASATQDLASAAADNCLPDALTPAWNTAFDAWMGISHLRMGPQEQATLSMAYWPDDRSSGRRTLARLIADEDAMGTDVEAFSEVSAAARGLYALESMLYDPQFNDYLPGSYSCTLVTVMTQDLAEQARAVNAAWNQKFAAELRNAGATDNGVYLSTQEAERAIFTQLHAGIEFIADQRLGRPMGTLDHPRPQRAETWRANRSMRNVTLSLEALHQMATALAGQPLEAVDQAFDTAKYFAGTIADPAFQDITDPQARLRLESLQGRVRTIGDVLIVDIGETMGIAPGFNSADGD